MKLKINHKIIRFLPILLIITVLISVSSPFYSPSNTQANPPADVFTGQIIPAFIGAEYDPTEAFQQLAGATIYVWAYDNWDNTDGNPVSNLAVKTQIRADGTFQAMGLPHATYYGVYFPYDEKGPTEPKGASYLCAGTIAACGYPYVFPMPNNTNCCDYPIQGLSSAIQMVPFRTPIGTDSISDVFSYSQIPFAYNKDVQTQIFNEFIHPEGRQIFVTSNNKLDIENHINVFPVVPTSVLKMEISTDHYGFTVTSPQSSAFFLAEGLRKNPISFTATRIGYYRKPDNIDIALPTKFFYTYGPVISGKTTKDGFFKAYAPTGYYLIEYSNDESSGIAFKEIDSVGQNNIPLDNVASDKLKMTSQWFTSTTDYNTRPNPWLLYQDSVHLWGIVTQTTLATEKVNNAPLPLPQEVMIPAPLINVLVESIPTSTSKRNFDPVSLDNNIGPGASDICTSDPNKCNIKDTNALGVYYFRTSDVNSPVTGSIKLVNTFGDLNHGPILANIEYDQSETTLPALAAGVYNTNFTLYTKPNVGFLLKVVDSSDKPVSGVDVTVVSKKNFTTKKSMANEKGSFTTNNDGEVYLSPYIFTEKSSWTNCAEEAVTEDYVVIAKQGDKFEAQLTLYNGDGDSNGDKIADGGEVSPTICESFSGLKTSADFPNNKGYIQPLGKTNENNEPGMIQMAQALQMNFFNVYAEEGKQICEDMGGIELLKVPGYLNGKVSEQQVVVLILNSKGEVLDGTPNAAMKIDRDAGDNINTVKMTTPGMAYDPKSGVAMFFLPCATNSGGWTVKVEAGSSITSAGTNMNDVIAAGPQLGWGDAFKALITHPIAIPMAEIKSILGNSSELKDLQIENLNQKYAGVSGTVLQKDQVLQGLVLGTPLVSGSRRTITEQLYVNDSGTSLEYFVSPSSLNLYLLADCPSVSFDSNFFNAIQCAASRTISSNLKWVGELLEKTILHTPPISSIPTVTFLWNTMRNIANGIAIIFVLYFVLRFMLRLDSKDLPLKDLPVRLVKGVFFANISLLYCQFFIDLSNICVRVLTQTINSSFEYAISAGGTPNGYGVAGIATAAAGILAQAGGTGLGAASAVMGVGTAAAGSPIVAFLGFALLGFIVAVLLLVVVILAQFLIRLAVIYVCVALAPIRFMSSILPSLESVGQLWDTTFFGFVFLQVIAALLLGIGNSLLSYAPVGQGPVATIGQTAIGIAIGFITIKSPSMLLGLIGGGGAGGKLLGAAGEGLGEATAGMQQHFGAEAMAGRVGQFRKQEELTKLGDNATTGQKIKHGAGTVFGGIGALTGIRPLAGIKKARQQGAGMAVQQEMRRIQEPAMLASLKDQQRDAAFTAKAGEEGHVISKDLKKEAAESGIPSASLGAWTRNAFGQYSTLNNNDQLHLDTGIDDTTTGKNIGALVQNYNQHIVESDNGIVNQYLQGLNTQELQDLITNSGAGVGGNFADLAALQADKKTLESVQTFVKSDSATLSQVAKKVQGSKLIQIDGTKATVRGDQVADFSRSVMTANASVPGVQELQAKGAQSEFDASMAWAQQTFESRKHAYGANNARLRAMKQRAVGQGNAMDDTLRMQMMQQQYGQQP